MRRGGAGRLRSRTGISTASATCPSRETRPEHFDRALADGKVSTNVYLRRIHNHALGMEWLLKSVIPRLQWPKPVFKTKRAITAEEHAADRPARTKPGAAGFLRNAVAYRRVANRRGLSAGGGCGLEHAHDLLHAQETEVAWHGHQAGADPVSARKWKPFCGGGRRRGRCSPISARCDRATGQRSFTNGALVSASRACRCIRIGMRGRSGR